MLLSLAFKVFFMLEISALDLKSSMANSASASPSAILTDSKSFCCCWYFCLASIILSDIDWISLIFNSFTIPVSTVLRALLEPRSSRTYRLEKIQSTVYLHFQVPKTSMKFIPITTVSQASMGYRMPPSSTARILGETTWLTFLSWQT